GRAVGVVRRGHAGQDAHIDAVVEEMLLQVVDVLLDPSERRKIVLRDDPNFHPRGQIVPRSTQDQQQSPRLADMFYPHHMRVASALLIVSFARGGGGQQQTSDRSDRRKLSDLQDQLEESKSELAKEKAARQAAEGALADAQGKCQNKIDAAVAQAK